jgi:hypothetical protein
MPGFRRGGKRGLSWNIENNQLKEACPQIRCGFLPKLWFVRRKLGITDGS